MVLTDEELAALIHVGTDMIFADGKVTEEEKVIMASEIAKKASSPYEYKVISDSAFMMPAKEALMILANMTEPKKKYASGLMASLMVCDGDVDPVEMHVWQILNNLFWGTPHYMEVSEALRYWLNNQ